MSNVVWRCAVVSVAALALAACRGGGGSGGAGNPAPTYTIGGIVSGLAGTGLVLRNNGGNDLSISGNGAFTFSTALAGGASYNVTVSTQPTATPAQRCTVSGGSGVANASVTSVTIVCAVLVGRFAYVPNTGSGTVSAYAIDAGTGALTALPGSPFPSNPSPRHAAADPAAKFLYVPGVRPGVVLPDPGATQISAYKIDVATGALTQLAASPFDVGVAPPASAAVGKPLIHPSGGFLYVSAATQPDNMLAGMTVDSATGALSPIAGTPILWGILGSGTFDSAGRTLYLPATLRATLISLVAAYGVSAPSGVLTALQPSYATGGFAPTPAVLSRGGDFLFVPQFATGGSLAVLAVDPAGAVLGAVTGSPFSTGSSAPATAVAAHPSKNFVYVTNSGQPFLTPGPPGPASIAAFRYDASGVVTPIAGSPFPTGGTVAVAASVDPIGRFVIVANNGSNSIQVFAIDQISGALTPAVGGPFPTELAPTGAAIDSSGKYLYAVNKGANTVSAYAINATTGALSLINTLPTGSSPVHVEIVSP